MGRAQHLDQCLLHQVFRSRPVGDPRVDDAPDDRDEGGDIRLVVGSEAVGDRLVGAHAEHLGIEADAVRSDPARHRLLASRHAVQRSR